LTEAILTALSSAGLAVVPVGMRDALKKISEHDVPRPVGEPWAKDGKPSKHDKCTHGNWMWADCDNCTAEFAAAALPPLASGGG